MRDPLPDHSTVAVLGLGAAGRAACRLLSALGKRVFASDARTDIDFEPPPGVELRLGENGLFGAMAVVLSPGLNPEWPENAENPALAPIWAAAREGTVRLVSEIELAVTAAALPTLAVGGTDGKSTTVAMARDLVAAAGARPVFGGNSWTALSDVVLGTPDGTACVAEVSAFQLWGGHRLHPRVALLTNIAADHLDHYASEDDYVVAKWHLLEHLGAGDTAVLSAGDARLTGFRDRLLARGVTVLGYGAHRPEGPWSGTAWRDGDLLRVEAPAATLTVPVEAIAVPGAHNLRNALGALLAATALGVGALDAVGAEEALRNFRGLPHRLQPVRTLDGVLWLDDSKATNVHAAVTGLTSLDRPVVAIVGGVDKKLDLAPMFDALDRAAHHVVVIGEITERFVREAGARAWGLERAATLEEAVCSAQQAARDGDAVVLAPGCSSFDMFAGFEARGRAYQTAVNAQSARTRSS